MTGKFFDAWHFTVIDATRPPPEVEGGGPAHHRAIWRGRPAAATRRRYH